MVQSPYRQLSVCSMSYVSPLSDALSYDSGDELLVPAGSFLDGRSCDNVSCDDLSCDDAVTSVSRVTICSFYP